MSGFFTTARISAGSDSFCLFDLRVVLVDGVNEYFTKRKRKEGKSAGKRVSFTNYLYIQCESIDINTPSVPDI